MKVRQFLEESGLTCWMDIGQMGGGDSLYTRWPVAAAGPPTARQDLPGHLHLPRPALLPLPQVPGLRLLHQGGPPGRPPQEADPAGEAVVGSTLVQVVIARTPWPPPGPLAMILAPLVYTDLGGAGGHGGQVGGGRAHVPRGNTRTGCRR